MILLLCLLTCVNSGMGENVFDVRNYTDNELIDIMLAIYDADTNLGYLYFGDVLEVGKDIPAGHYEFWIEDSDVGGGVGILFEVQCSKEKKTYDNYINFKDDEYGNHKLMVLEEGQYVWLTDWHGIGIIGVRLKYIPNRKSGLFTAE